MMKKYCLTALMAMVLYFSGEPSVQAQSLQSAIEFVYCGDSGLENCGLNIKMDSCKVSVQSTNQALKVSYDLDFNKVIWTSAEINHLTKRVTASCRGSCMVDVNGDMKRLYSLMGGEVTGITFNESRLDLGFTETSDRVARAFRVIVQHCPGVSSDF